MTGMLFKMLLLLSIRIWMRMQALLRSFFSTAPHTVWVLLPRCRILLLPLAAAILTFFSYHLQNSMKKVSHHHYHQKKEITWHKHILADHRALQQNVLYFWCKKKGGWRRWWWWCHVFQQASHWISSRATPASSSPENFQKHIGFLGIRSQILGKRLGLKSRPWSFLQHEI